MIELNKPYLTQRDEYIFNIDGLIGHAGNPKVVISIENGSLVEVEFMDVSEQSIPHEDWWELQGIVSNQIKDLLNEK